MTQVLLVHVVAAYLSLLSGGVALVARRGRRAHRTAGTVFFGSMLIMGVLGAHLGFATSARLSAVAGLLTVYLVATAWMTLRRPAGGFEVIACVWAFAVAAGALTIGILGARQPSGLFDGMPYQPAFVFAGLAAASAAADLSFLRRSGVAGANRIARHLWRMCAALTIAALSFVTQPKALPEAWRGEPLLFAPILLVLAIMVVELVRVRLRKSPRASKSALQLRSNRRMVQ